MKNKVVGIDLGTSTCCVAVLNDMNEAVVVPNKENSMTTPSVVFFPEKEEWDEESSYVVGEVAKESAIIYPERTCEYVKRKMGDPNSKVAISVDGIDYSPEMISSMQLMKVVNDAEEYLDAQIKEAVITCPAYFGSAEREAIINAADMAGLKVLKIINEPTAAALSYGCQRAENDQYILVYDLGGGTFDVTVIKVTPQEICVIATDGDHQLGGKDFDAVVIPYLQDAFSEATGWKGDFEPEELQELQLKTERAKHQLTAREKTSVAISAGGKRAGIELTREIFEDLTSALLRKTIDKTNDVLEAAKAKGVDNVDEIILVGGSSKMPQVKKTIETNYPGIPVKLYEADTAVAKGAAIHAANLKKMESIPGQKGPVLKNVTSKSFGIEVVIDDVDTDGNACKALRISNLITRQDAVPVTVVKNFGTAYANMDTADLKIYETDEDVNLYEIGEHKPLGTAVLELPAGLPEGTPIEVTLELSSDGQLKVRGFEHNSGKEVRATLHSDAIKTKEELEKEKEILHHLTLLG